MANGRGDEWIEWAAVNQPDPTDDEAWAMALAADDQIARADVAAVLRELRDALTADKAYGAVGRVQSAMHQLGVEY